MSVASLFAHGDVTGRDQDVGGRDRKITQLGLKAAHFKHLHIGKEVPTRQHYEEIPHIPYPFRKGWGASFKDLYTDARRMGNKQDEIEMCVCKVSGCEGVNFPHSSPYSVALCTCS